MRGRTGGGKQERSMKEAEVRARAFAMPLTNPAYPPGPYRFVDREFMIITYRTDMDKLRAVVPEPLEVVEPLVSTSCSDNENRIPPQFIAAWQFILLLGATYGQQGCKFHQRSSSTTARTFL
jgi:hypothetical protein